MKIINQIKSIKWMNISLFYALALGLTYIATLFPNFIRELWKDAPFNWNHGIALLIASIVGYLIFKPKKETTFLGNNPIKSIIFACIFLAAYSIYGFSNKFNINPHLWALIFCIMTLIYDFFEESTWRGFLNDSLNPKPFWLKGIITGIFWGFWHLLIFDSFKQFGGLHIFVLFAIVVSVIMAYATDKTKSILVASSIHALMILRDINVTIICALIWVLLIIFWDKNSVKLGKPKTINE